MKMKINCGIFLLLFSSSLAAEPFEYPAENDKGTYKDEINWGGKCKDGQRQSPIDITDKATVIGYFPNLVFKNYDKSIREAKVRNTGHSLQIDIAPDQEYVLTGGGLPGAYVMDQMHFHWGSEHLINGQRFGLELHIVSHEQRHKNISMALNHKNGISVLAILFHVSDQINLTLKNILDSAESVMKGPGPANPLMDYLSPEQLLPKERSSYYRYEGSLTTPGCNEFIIWTVLRKSIPFSMTQIERFHEMKTDHGNKLTANYRPPQKLNSRPLVLVKSYYDESSSAVTKTVNMGMLVIVCAVSLMHLN